MASREVVPECTCGDPGQYPCERHDCLGGLEEVRGPDWKPGAPDSAGIEAALAAGLAAHEGRSFDLTTPRAYTQHGGWNVACSCGAHICSHPGDECSCHRVHVAAALLPVVTQAQAEAWRKGYHHGVEDMTGTETLTVVRRNPYRARADESGGA